MNKNLKVILVIGLVIALGLSVFSLAQSNKKAAVECDSLGGLNHNTMEDFAEGISVDGTTVLDGDGAFYGSGTVGSTGSCASTTALTVVNGLITSCN